MTSDKASSTRVKLGLAGAALILALALGTSVFLLPSPAIAATVIYECMNDPGHPDCQACGPNEVCAFIWYDLGPCCTNQGMAGVVCVSSCVQPFQNPCNFRKLACEP